MKKIILTMVAMMTMTVGFAKTENQNAQNAVKNVERYDMTIDMRRLSAKLDLTENQMEAVQVIHENFNDAMQSAAEANWFERRHMVHEAVSKDVHHMHNVLNEDQFNTYMALLMTTLRNKGL
jgi:hypothetical protein